MGNCYIFLACLAGLFADLAVKDIRQGMFAGAAVILCFAAIGKAIEDGIELHLKKTARKKD